MPFVNLAVAQAAAAWIAAPNIVGLAMGYGPETYYVIAAASAVIILIGAYIGSRVTDVIAPPSLLSTIAAVSFAIIAAAAAMIFLAPSVATNELAAHGFTFAPVAAAIAGYFYASRRETP